MKSITALALSLLVAGAVDAQPKPSMKAPVIRQGTLSEKDLTEIQTLLKEMSPGSFNAVISQPGKGSVRLGNAAMKDLSTKSVIHGAGARPSAADEIATSVSNYIRVIWTSSITGADKARMDRVNALLAK